MAKDITVYTKDSCAYCVMVKRWLSSKGMNYQEVNVDHQPERQQEAIVASGGAQTLPITVVTKEDDSRDVIIGWNLSRLAPAVS